VGTDQIAFAVIEEIVDLLFVDCIADRLADLLIGKRLIGVASGTFPAPCSGFPP